MRKLVLAALLPAVTLLSTAGNSVPAGAAEAVIRGDSLTYDHAADRTRGLSGSSAPTTVLRGIPPGQRPAIPHTPASNLGSDADGAFLPLPCLYTDPPTCR